MKKLLLTLVSMFILFVTGCKENIMDPNTSELNKPDNIISDRINQGKIPLEGIVIDPTVPGGEDYNLNGVIYFEHNLISGPEPIATVVLSLNINASLESFYGMWIFSGESVDTLQIYEFGYMLEKLFIIPELNKTFCIEFFVTSSNVVLSGRCFEYPVIHPENSY